MEKNKLSLDELSQLFSDLYDGNLKAKFEWYWYRANDNNAERIKENAVYWLSRVKENEDAEAQYYLGVCYLRGEGVEESPEQAVYWWTKAAMQGYTNAQFCLGECYSIGYGVESDCQQAAYWYKNAMQQGHQGAAFELADLSGKEQAMSLFLKNAVMNFPEPSGSSPPEKPPGINII